MDRATREEIDRIAAATLRDAGLGDPPLAIEELLQHVQLHRDYYDLANPGFLDRAKHKLRIHGRRLVEVVNRVRLQAVLLFDENRICIDHNLPKIKHPWASCHETGHRLLPWHKPFFFGDTAQTLDPGYQADLEDEANYAAGRLLFLGDRFTQEARDMVPTVEAVKGLAKRYRALWVPEILAAGFRKFWRRPRRDWPTELMPDLRWGRQAQDAWSALMARRA